MTVLLLLAKAAIPAVGFVVLAFVLASLLALVREALNHTGRYLPQSLHVRKVARSRPASHQNGRVELL